MGPQAALSQRTPGVAARPIAVLGRHFWTPLEPVFVEEDRKLERPLSVDAAISVRYRRPMLHLLALAGALPALLAMYIVDRADAKRPEPRSTLRRVALAGALSCIPAAILELLLMKLGPSAGIAGALFTAFVVAAAIEEGGKALCIRWFVWNRPEFDERTDGIVYGTRAGLGFALLENVGYLLGAKTMSGFLAIFVVRAMFTVPMHAVAGGLLGHHAAWRRFEGRGPGVLGGYALAVFIHGAFDAGVLVLPTLLAEKDYVSMLLAILGSAAVVGGGLVALRRAWKQALAADEAAALLRGALPAPA
jgi:RsiW-degrading membrane proteinase PrsW (M82 family)